MFKNYFTIAWRSLLRNKLYSLINVFGLSIGISACLVIFLIVRFELSFNNFQADDINRIYRVYTEMSGDYSGINRGVAAAAALSARTELAGLDNSTPLHGFGATVYVTDKNQEQRNFERQTKVAITDPSYFELFKHYRWISGTPQNSLGKPFHVVLTESKAKLYFGISDPKEALDREIHYRDSLVLTVSGIIADPEGNTDFDFTDFISLATVEKSWLKKNIHLNDWNSTNSGSQFFVKLSAGTDPSTIEKGLAILIEKNRKKDSNHNMKVAYRLQPLADLHFNGKLGTFDHGRSAAHLPTLRILTGVAVLLLLIASINFINLETAQALRRAREVGIRKVMGSSRTKLILHFMIQSVFLTFFAVLLSLPLSEFAINFFTEFIPKGVKLNLVEPLTIGFLLFTLISVSFLAGFYPAFSLSSFVPAVALKNQISQTNHQTRSGAVRKSLIVFQFTIAQVLIVGALVVGSQISYMLDKDLGFSKEAIVYFDTPWWDKHSKVSVLKNELGRIPEIQAFTLCSSPPATNGWSSSTFIYNNGKKDIHTEVFHKNGDSSYFSVFDLKLVAGRNLYKSDSVLEFIINETFARQLGFQKPEEALGKLIGGDNKYPVVGVVKDYNFRSLHNAIEPIAMANEEARFGCFGIKLSSTRGEDIHRALEKIEVAWKKVYPDQKIETHFLDETIARFYEKEQRTSKLVNTATAIAILISCLGLFGLASFTAMQRTKEIGIRKVLGATVSNIVTLLSKEFLRLVIIAFVVATPLSYFAATRWLADFPYQTMIGFTIYGWTILAGIIIVLLSVSYQAVKAALTDPAESLRYE